MKLQLFSNSCFPKLFRGKDTILDCIWNVEDKWRQSRREKTTRRQSSSFVQEGVEQFYWKQAWRIKTMNVLDNQNFSFFCQSGDFFLSVVNARHFWFLNENKSCTLSPVRLCLDTILPVYLVVIWPVIIWYLNIVHD